MSKRREPSSLFSHIGYKLRKVSNAVSHTFAQKVADSGVTVAEWVILRDMYREGETSATRIAASTGLTKGAVSKLVDRLSLKRLILRVDSKEDGRAQHLRLSAAAEKLLPELAELADQNDKHFFDPLTAAERKTLTAILDKLAEAHNLKASPTE